MIDLDQALSDQEKQQIIDQLMSAKATHDGVADMDALALSTRSRGCPARATSSRTDRGSFAARRGAPPTPPSAGCAAAQFGPPPGAQPSGRCSAESAAGALDASSDASPGTRADAVDARPCRACRRGCRSCPSRRRRRFSASTLSTIRATCQAVAQALRSETNPDKLHAFRRSRSRGNIRSQLRAQRQGCDVRAGWRRRTQVQPTPGPSAQPDRPIQCAMYDSNMTDVGLCQHITAMLMSSTDANALGAFSEPDAAAGIPDRCERAPRQGADVRADPDDSVRAHPPPCRALLRRLHGPGGHVHAVDEAP